MFFEKYGRAKNRARLLFKECIVLKINPVAGYLGSKSIAYPLSILSGIHHMEVEFFWIEDRGRKEPYLKTSVKNNNGLDLLACLLSDDGGLGYKRLIEDIDKGIYEVNLIEEGKSKTFDWALHSWGAVLGSQQVKIYSLYDENYFVMISFNDFEKVLKGWRRFMSEE